MVILAHAWRFFHDTLLVGIIKSANEMSKAKGWHYLA